MPPDETPGRATCSRAEWSMEFDVVTHAAGARPRGARARRARRPRRHPQLDRGFQADDRLQPDGGVRRRRHLRPERRQLPRAAARAVHRLQSARADCWRATRRCRRSCSPITAFPCPTSWSCRSARKPAAAEAVDVSADRQVADATRPRSASRRPRSSTDEDQLSERVQFIHETHRHRRRSSSSSSTAASSTSACSATSGCRCFPVWEMSFAKMPENGWRIATERVKWNVAVPEEARHRHQRRAGLARRR